MFQDYSAEFKYTRTEELSEKVRKTDDTEANSTRIQCIALIAFI